MINVLFVKCPSTPEVCLCVFPFWWVHWAAGFNFPGVWVQFSIHWTLSHAGWAVSPNLVPTNNWGIIPYLCWLELMFSCAAFDMRYVRSCSTLSPVLEDKMTYGGGLWLYWRWTEYWGNCHTNFPTSVPPNINIRFVC